MNGRFDISELKSFLRAKTKTMYSFLCTGITYSSKFKLIVLKYTWGHGHNIDIEAKNNKENIVKKYIG